jgi:hypothetical protein
LSCAAAPNEPGGRRLRQARDRRQGRVGLQTRSHRWPPVDHVLLITRIVSTRSRRSGGGPPPGIDPRPTRPRRRDDRPSPRAACRATGRTLTRLMKPVPRIAASLSSQRSSTTRSASCASGQCPSLDPMHVNSGAVGPGHATTSSPASSSHGPRAHGCRGQSTTGTTGRSRLTVTPLFHAAKSRDRGPRLASVARGLTRTPGSCGRSGGTSAGESLTRTASLSHSYSIDDSRSSRESMDHAVTPIRTAPSARGSRGVRLGVHIRTSVNQLVPKANFSSPVKYIIKAESLPA